ncbi:MAG: hypothetical protein ABWY64_16130, partial [Tardiphaga sp.]
AGPACAPPHSNEMKTFVTLGLLSNKTELLMQCEVAEVQRTIFHGCFDLKHQRAVTKKKSWGSDIHRYR